MDRTRTLPASRRNVLILSLYLTGSVLVLSIICYSRAFNDSTCSSHLATHHPTPLMTHVRLSSGGGKGARGGIRPGGIFRGRYLRLKKREILA